MNKEQIDSLRLEMANRTGNQFYERELGEIIHLSETLGNCKSFVDVGASLGPYTWSANMLLEGASITAVEANPMLCKHLVEQWKDIEAKENNNRNTLKVINAALSDCSGTLDFYINKDNYLNSFIGGVVDLDYGDKSHEKVKLPTLSLDEMFPDEAPDFVKIDIEGAEWRALKGAKNLLAKRRTRFLVEIHPWGDASNNIRPSDVFSLMSKANYSVERLNQHWLFLPNKPSLAGRIKAAFFGFVLNHPSIRKLAKLLLLGR